MDVPKEGPSQLNIRKNVVLTPKSPSFAEGLRDLTECPICTETYTDPRILPCLHTFCFQCLKTLYIAVDRKPGDAVPCPICRQKFSIPSSGLSALPKNFFLGRLLDLQRTELSERGENFYEEHCREHKHCGLSKDQPMISCWPIGFREKVQEQSEVRFCKQHVDKQLDLYCLECKQVICVTCYSGSHQRHCTEHVYRAVNQVTAEILGYVDEVDALLKHVFARKQCMDKAKMEFLKELENAAEMVLKRSKMLKDLIEDHTKTLMAELKAIQETKLKEFETDKDELERHLIMAKSFKTYCNQVRFAYSPVAACYAISDVRARADEILHLRNSEMRQKDHVVKVSFDPSEVEEFLKTTRNNFIEKVEAKIDEKRNGDSGPSDLVQSKISAQFTAKLDINYRKVFGVTIMQNYIYVLCQSPNGILVYDYEAPFGFKKQMAMRMTKNPFDVASSLKSGSLYIADTDNCVWKLNVRDARISTWLRCTGQPHKLSVSRQGNILIMNMDFSLSLHTEDCILISKIPLPSNIRRPMHACETSVGNVVLCYKDDESWSICELNRNGLVLHSFLSKEGLQTDGPLHLVIDSDDRALIADFSNNRVVVFDSNLSKYKVLLTEEKDDIFGPLGMCYDRDKHQLMVAHGAGLGGATQVFIYSLPFL